MKNIAQMNVKDFFILLVQTFKKMSVKQRIILLVVVLLSVFGYIYGKGMWKKHTVFRQAQEIISKISQSQKDFLEKTGEYKKNLFAEEDIAASLNIYVYTDVDTDMDFENSTMRMGRRSRFNKSEADYNTGRSGDFYIELDNDNACIIMKYKNNSPEKTTFFASYAEGKAFCQGKMCKHKKGGGDSLCYRDGVCFTPRLVEKTQRYCGNGRGLQTRKCTPSCNGGDCESWGECVCQKGFKWNGKTCVQSQTEKDCTEQECFNGIYCEEKGPLVKNIENGICKRYSSCLKQKGWIYTDWNCSCDDDNLCASQTTCIIRPENQNEMELPNQQGNCKEVSYVCENGHGWKALAKECICAKIGTFWDEQLKEAKCSNCTKKPINASFTSSAQGKDACSWECNEGYSERNGDCLKPNGQYLCVGMDLQICTDDFSKDRKLKKDTKTNEGQLCFVEDKDNILFYNKKEKSCQLCQCFALESGNKN